MLGSLGRLLGLGEDAAADAATPAAAGTIEPTTQVVAPAGAVDPEQPVIAATADGGSAIVPAGTVPASAPVVTPAAAVDPAQPVVIHDPVTTAAKVAPFLLVGVIGWYFLSGRKNK